MQEIEGSPTEKETTQPTDDQGAECSAGLAVGQEAANPDKFSGLDSGCVVRVVVESQDTESQEARSNQQREDSDGEESFTVPEELQET